MERSYLIIRKKIVKPEDLGQTDSGYTLTLETIWEGAKNIIHPPLIFQSHHLAHMIG